MIYAIVAVLILIADQAVKLWTTKNIVLNAVGEQCKPLIDGIVHMTNVHNYGAAFGILQNARWPLAIVSALFVIVIIVLINKEIIHTGFGKWLSVLVVAGALGNCIDRVLYGYVVDMFEFEFVKFAVFNVADIFITVCGVLFCIHLIFHNEPEAVKQANEPEFMRRRREKEAARTQAAPEAEAAPAVTKAAPRARRVHKTAEEPPAAAAQAPAEEQLVQWSFGEEEDFRVPEPAPAPAPAPKAKAKKAAGRARPAPAPAPEPEPEPILPEEEDTEEYSLEDILKEFGDF